MNGALFKDSVLKININNADRPNQEKEYPPHNLYLKGFPSAWSKDKIRDFIDDKFGEFGRIKSTEVFLNQTINLYFAFVAFQNPKSADSAFESMNNYKFRDGSFLYLNFA
jgi:RNA recognition motif-containing protein